MFRLTPLLALSCLAYGQNLNIAQGSSQPEFRIVGGRPTTIEKHPYQVALELKTHFSCGGSLIKPDFVLTAAKCTTGQSRRDLRVRAGTSKQSKGGQVARVVRIFEHPKYNVLTQDYDVSVLRLDSSLKLGETVQTIPLQPLNVAVPDNDDNGDETLGTVTGWGNLNYGGSPAKVLQEVSLPKAPDSFCETVYDDEFTPRMTCYGGDGIKGTCNSDSGGPLVVNGKQVGIVSWGGRCATKASPSVLTRIENEEIQNHINSCLKRRRQAPY